MYNIQPITIRPINRNRAMIIIPADSFGADLSMLAVCLLVSVAVVVVVVEMLIYSPLHSSRSLVGFVYLYLLF